jgi:2',3'-cyclic-nucleotide 2'-phosphodiesterase (5'-nucleotidase family)
LILEAMGALGYDALAVGERDLALGVEELKKRAAAARVPLLAANLVGRDGKKPFEQRRLLKVGGIMSASSPSVPARPSPAPV